VIVYFLRHASAGQHLATRRDDDKRPLDSKGVEQARLVGRLLSALGEPVDVIVSSPLKRATQTASLVANELGHEGKIELNPALRPDAKYSGFRTLLEELAGWDAVLVVGHNPTLSAFLSLLITGGTSAEIVDMKKAALAKVEVAGRSSLLRWLVTPAMADAVYESTGARSRPNRLRK
jgi:phosphohistidine phosphatase